MLINIVEIELWFGGLLCVCGNVDVCVLVIVYMVLWCKCDGCYLVVVFMYGVLLLVLWLMCEFGIDVVLDVFEYYFIGCECMYDFDGVLLLYGLEVCLV